MNNVHLVNNSIIEHFIAIFRNKDTSPYLCQICVENISFFLAGEVSNLLLKKDVNIITPLGNARGYCLDSSITLLPIQRAGLSMLPSFQKLLPYSEIACIALKRNKDYSITLLFEKMSDNLGNQTIIILDTMLATGGSMLYAIDRVAKRYGGKIIISCLFATNIGINNILNKYKDIPIVACTINESLDDNNYVFPGVGDAGDRLFGKINT